MGKRKDKKYTEKLYNSLLDISAQTKTDNTWPAFTAGHGDTPIADEILASSKEMSHILDSEAKKPRELRKMKKFRFQLLHQWMITHLKPCRVADIGGGKGLLAYLLQKSGWPATVIDPIRQPLPAKYKDIVTGERIRIAATEEVPYIDKAFEPAMAKNFDLLVAMHAHGCNIKIIDAAAQFGRSFILLPCCIINEPIYPPPDTHWLQCVIDYATQQGFAVASFRLNFKGQNISFYAKTVCCT